MNIFQQAFHYIVFLPLTNSLQLLYNYTGDIGFAIILLAVIVNIILYPLFASSYVNGQKMKIFQPKIKEIQNKYKDDRNKLVEETIAFNKKHSINNGSIFLVLFVQLFFVGGIFYLVRDIASGKDLPELYSWLFENTTANFEGKAFGFIDIGQFGREIIWLPALNALISLAYSYYSFNLTPKLNLPKAKPDPNSPIDQEEMQKSIQKWTIFFLPGFLFFINLNFPAGVVVYSITLSILSLLRQIVMSNYYASHLDKLIGKIADSDPTSRDDDPSNNLEIRANPADLADEPIATKFIDVEVKEKKKKKKKPLKGSKKKK